MSFSDKIPPTIVINGIAKPASFGFKPVVVFKEPKSAKLATSPKP